MSDNDRESDRGFKVTDRRQFTSEGEVRAEADPAEAADPTLSEEKVFRGETILPGESTSESTPSREPGGESPDRDRNEEAPDLEAIQFSSFILSLASGVLVHLGEIPDPQTGQADENLEAAQQTIDLLGMLKEKTEGNLTAEENHLLESVLYELRVKFLSKSKTIKL